MSRLTARVRPARSDLANAKVQLIQTVTVVRRGRHDRDRRRRGRRRLTERQPPESSLRNRPGDIAVDRGVVGAPLDSRDALVGRADLHVDLGHRVRAQDLQLRLHRLLHVAGVQRRREGAGDGWGRQQFDEWRPVAELSGAARVDDVAVVGRLFAAADSALEDEAVRQPGIDADVESVPVVDLVAAGEEGVAAADEVVRSGGRRRLLIEEVGGVMPLGSVTPPADAGAGGISDCVMLNRS